MQADRIAFAFHGEPQHTARQFIGFDGGVTDRFKRQPSFVESRLEDDKSRGIEGTVVEPAHVMQAIESATPPAD